MLLVSLSIIWNFEKKSWFWWVPSVGQCGSHGCRGELGGPSQRNAGKLSLCFATQARRFLNLVSFREFCEEWERTEWRERKDLEAETGTGPEVGIVIETAGGTETEMREEGKICFFEISIRSFFLNICTIYVTLYCPGPDPGTEVTEIRSHPRGASLVCTGMCRPRGLSTSRPCSTRACSRAARSPPPWCPTRPRYRWQDKYILSSMLKYFSF